MWSLDKIAAFSKSHGLAFQAGELYGGIGAGYDYGPAGAALKRNVADLWWRSFVSGRVDCVGMDAALLSHPRALAASGHVARFVDSAVECRTCSRRHRADKVLAAAATALGPERAGIWSDAAALAAATPAQLGAGIRHLAVVCPACGTAPSAAAGLGEPVPFNLLFETAVGAGAGATPAYLRPETAQGVYVNFANILGSSRKRLPLGVGQVGRAFRNEVSPGGFLFRTREFEQMELQYFCAPGESSRWHAYWVDFCERWLLGLGLSPARLRRHAYAPGELAHYALATTDLEFRFPWGWDELCGIANRGDYDLRAHASASGAALTYTDPDTRASFTPHAVEPALGLNRLVLALIADGLRDEPLPGGNGAHRTLLRLHEDLAPHAAAVLPVVRNREPLVAAAQGLLGRLLPLISTDYDATQSVGKRYRRQDELGTPLCITVDGQTLADGSVTLRNRDSMAQVRMHADEVVSRAQMRTLKPSAIVWPPPSSESSTALFPEKEL